MTKVSKLALFVILSLGILHLPIYPQSIENGAIQGRVSADTGEFLPGAEVKLSSPNLIGGDQFVITNEVGRFRFIALPPGTYSVTAALEGFTRAMQGDIRLHADMTLTIDLVLAVGGLEEEVVVLAEAPLVDVKDSAQASTAIPIEIFQSIPNTQNLQDAIELAPGVTDRMAYGGIQRGASNNYQMDGANFDDPGDGAGYRLGSMDYNTIEEAKMSGIGANAEYDGFTGAVFSVITKSGGNDVRGDVNFLTQNNNWNSDNTGDTGISTPAQQSYYDLSTHLGGPLKKDKLWFYLGFRGYYRQRKQPGFEQDSTNKNGIIFTKFTWQASKNNRLRLHLNYNISRGDYSGGGPKRAVETTRLSKSDYIFWNLNLLHTFSDTTFLEAKYNGWIMDNRSEPKGGNDVKGHRDYVTKWRTVNSTGWWQGYVWINNLQTTVSHHASDFLGGSHDFKFGVSAYGGGAHDQRASPGGGWYLDYDGAPFYRYDYVGLEGIEAFPLIYNLEPRNTVLSGFAQDSWSVSDRLTLNFGLRYNTWKVTFQARREEDYKDSGFAPRFGFSYDVFGDHSTAIKAHYGRYYDKANFVALYALSPANADQIAYKWENGQWEYAWTYWGSLPDGTTPTSMDKNIEHASIDQFSLGISRELGRDLSLELTYIFRNSNNFLETVNLTAEWEKVTITDPYTGNSHDIYNQTNNPDDDRYFLTNPKVGQTGSVLIEPTKKYHAFVIVLNKRFANNWMLRTSYTYGSLKGTYDNTYQQGIALYSDFYKDPTYQINADGRCTAAPTHIFKVQGMGIVPKVDINIGAHFQLVTGYNYTRTLRVGGLGQGSTNLFTESKGSRTMPTLYMLDIRFEKFFLFGDNSRFGITFDIFNVLNVGTARNAEWEYGLVTEAGPEFESVQNIVDARSFRVGFRFSF